MIDVNGKKLCSGECGQLKDASEFYPNRYRPDGVDNKCKLCRLALNRRWNADHPAAYKRAKRRYYLRAKYDLSEDDYDRLVEAQDDRCGICGTREQGARHVDGSRTWHIDHNHTTGAVRGLLCQECNTESGTLRKLLNDHSRLDKMVVWLGSDVDCRSVRRLFSLEQKEW